MSTSSNEIGIRLKGAQILWMHENSSEGNSHLSNTLDIAYALEIISVNGDMPVIVMCGGPDMGR